MIRGRCETRPEPALTANRFKMPSLRVSAYDDFPSYSPAPLSNSSDLDAEKGEQKRRDKVCLAR
jgi:hypothetical protein